MIQICLSYSYIKTSPRYNHMTTAYSFSKMPSINDPAITKFTKPYESTHHPSPIQTNLHYF